MKNYYRIFRNLTLFISIFILNLNQYSVLGQTYCPIGVISSVEPISLVQFAGINNPTGSIGTAGYQDFTYIPGAVTAGNSYTMTLKGNTVGNNTCYFRAYIDWNGDGDFFDADESIDVGTITNSTGDDSKTVTKSITVPSCDVAPAVRMRIIKNYNGYDYGPCALIGYGQIEDYTLLISNPGGMTAYTVTGGNPDMPNAPVGLSGSTVGISYQLLRNGIPVGSPVAGTGNPISFGNQTAGIYTVEAIQSGSCKKTMTGSVSVAVVIFDYTGADQSYTIPSCASKVRVLAWGAGGAGGDAVKTNTTLGGGAGYATGDLDVTAGEQLTIIVGQQGMFRSDLYPTTYGGGGRGGYDGPYTGNGGGRSAVRRGTTELITAGGGGAGGETKGNGDKKGGYGGPGGGLTGGDGYKEGTTPGNYGGKGGTQTAGGAAGTGGNQQAPTAGSQFQGGNGGKQTGSNIREGGGGGGGYYGGGGGVGSDNQGGGGGGGSSYIGGVTNGSTIAGHATNGGAGNQDSEYNRGQYGIGGQTNSSGTNGRVVLEIIDVNITKPLIASITPPTCQDPTGSVTLSNLPSSGNWTLTQNPDLTTITGTGDTYTVNNLTPGTTYNWSVTNANGCTSENSDNAAIATLPPLDMPVINSVVANCTSASSHTVTNMNTSYTYHFIPSGPTIDSTGLISNAANGVSYSIYTTSENCISDTSLQFVPQAQLTAPDVPVIVSTPASCTSDEVSSIQNFNGTLNLNYVFSPAGPSVDANGTIVNMIVGTVYTVTASNTQCSSSSSSDFSNDAQVSSPATPIVAVVAATCDNAGFATIQNIDANSAYVFTPTGPTVSANGSISGADAGVNYTVVASFSSSCLSDPSQPFSVEPKLSAPNVQVSQVASICVGQSANLKATGADSYTWSPTNNMTPTTGSSVTVKPTSTTTYTVVGTNNSGCKDSTTITVNVSPIPQAQFTASETSGDMPLDVVFTNNSTNANSFSWDYGTGENSTTNDLSDVDYTFTIPGEFKVILTASNGVCTDTASVMIKVLDLPKMTLNIPNVFTPNGDGVNDEWYIDAQNAKSITVTILNRWGQKVFEINDLDAKWDGKGATDGTYFFKYKAIDLKDEAHEGNGFFHLLAK